MMRYILQTDQSVCYTESGSPIACGGTGQDGALNPPGNAWRSERFRILDYGVVDDITGAIWFRDANPAEFPMSWGEALEFVAKMRQRRAHGIDNWRLPSRRLLFSLVSHQHVNPALPENHPFVGVFNGYYWTSDTCSRLPDQAWYIHLGGGRIHRGMKHGSYLVWPVSLTHAAFSDARQSENDERFVSDGAWVRDIQTDLVWCKDANPMGHRLTWQEALRATAAFNAKCPGGWDDWRLPNIRELESIVELGSHSPALPTPHPFINVQDAYWSSTTSVYEPSYAWTLYSQDGFVGVGFKPKGDFYVWPVRNG